MESYTLHYTQNRKTLLSSCSANPFRADKTSKANVSVVRQQGNITIKIAELEREGDGNWLQREQMFYHFSNRKFLTSLLPSVLRLLENST